MKISFKTSSVHLFLILLSSPLTAMEEQPSKKRECAEHKYAASNRLAPIQTLKRIALNNVAHQLAIHPDLREQIESTLPTELQEELLKHLHQKYFCLLNCCFQNCIMTQPQKTINNLKIGGSGKYIFVMQGRRTGESAHIWNAISGQLVYTFDKIPQTAEDDSITAIALDDESQKAIISTCNGFLSFWDLSTGGPVLLHTIDNIAGAFEIFFDPANKNICIAKHFDATRWWDIEQGIIVRELDKDIFRSQGKALLLQPKVTDFSVPVLNLAGEELLRLIGNTALVTAAKVSSNDQFALTGTETGEIRVWDLIDGTCIQSFSMGGTAADKPIDLLAFCDDNKHAVVVSRSDTIQIVPLFSDKREWPHSVSLDTLSSTVSPYIEGIDEILKVIGNNIVIIRSLACAVVINFETEATDCIYLPFLFTCNKKNYAFACDERAITIIDTASFKKIATTDVHTGQISNADYLLTDDQSLMVTGSIDDQAWKLWNLKHNLTLPELVLVIRLQQAKETGEIIAYDVDTHNQLVALLDKHPQSREKFLRYFAQQLQNYMVEDSTDGLKLRSIDN